MGKNRVRRIGNVRVRKRRLIANFEKDGHMLGLSEKVSFEQKN